MPLRTLGFIIGGLVIAGAWPRAQVPVPAREQVVFLNDQQSLSPGYAVGDIAIGDPRIADFRVLPGRREILLFGKAVGSTRLTLWDQMRVKRDEIVINVTTRQAQELEQQLREMVRDFPSVEVRPLAGGFALAGAVSSKDDLAVLEKIAAAAKARNLVRFVPPSPAPPPAPLPAPPGGNTPAPVRGTGAAPAPTLAPATTVSEVEYEVELLEASAQFRSGSYSRGVEPSGRSLYKGVVRGPMNAERQIFIGGAAAGANPGASTQESGIRLTLKPIDPDARGRFKTGLLVETNLPFAGETYDPAVWRRARWEFATASGEPFGITGSDLLAAPDANGTGSSKLGTAARAASRVAVLPGASGAPGAELVPVFGSLFGSRSYKQKSTQLLVILRPRVVAPQP